MITKPSLFRLKPVDVMAMRWSGSHHSLRLIAAWVNAQPEVVPEGHEASGDPTLSWLTSSGHPAAPIEDVQLWTLTGVVNLEPGDWVLLRESGDFWKCEHETFLLKYEAVNE